jgi:hypothetical protein
LCERGFEPCESPVDHLVVGVLVDRGGEPARRRHDQQRCGGGCGSSSGAAGTVFQTGVNSGNGQVTITFDPATDACPVAPAAVIVTPKFTG